MKPSITFDPSFVGYPSVTPMVVDATGNLTSGGAQLEYMAYAANPGPPTLNMPMPSPGYGTSINSLVLQITDPNGAKYVRWGSIVLGEDWGQVALCLGWFGRGGISQLFVGDASGRTGPFLEPPTASASRSGNTVTITASNIVWAGITDGSGVYQIAGGPLSIFGYGADIANTTSGGGGNWWVGNEEITAPTALSQEATSPAGGGTISLTAGTSTQWTAVTQASWMHVVSGASGTGSGSVAYTYDANKTGSVRTGSIIIDDPVDITTYSGLFHGWLQITQDSLVVSPGTASFGVNGGAGTVTVTATGSWYGPTDPDSWVHLGTAPGSGNGSFSFTVDANATGTARSSTISLENGGTTVTLTQAAAGPFVSTTGLPNGAAGVVYPGATLTANGGTGTGYAWTASGLPAGLTLSTAGQLSGTTPTAGAFSVTLTVTDSAGNSGSKTLTLTVTTNLTPGWYSTGGVWTNRKKITVNTGVVTGTPTNFPMLVSVTDSNLQAVARTDGHDILFTAADGVTKLSHEIELYDPTTGTLAAWVSVPSLTGGTGLYVYYGNSGSVDQQQATAVWDSNYKGVYHFGANVQQSGGAWWGPDSTTNGITLNDGGWLALARVFAYARLYWRNDSERHDVRASVYVRRGVEDGVGLVPDQRGEREQQAGSGWFHRAVGGMGAGLLQRDECDLAV